RSFSSDRRSNYNLFGGKLPRNAKEFRREWAKRLEDEEDHLWSGSETETESESGTLRDNHTELKKEITKAKHRLRMKQSDNVDADDSDELHGLFSDSDDEERNTWTGDEGDVDEDIPTEPTPHPKSDRFIDTLFEFDEKRKFASFGEVLNKNYDDEEAAEAEAEEMSPGKQARKVAVENALKKLRKGADGRYTNVWEVMSDLDILIGAFENIISGPEYEELRKDGPKRLNMEFFKDIQAKMRDPKYKFSPEVKFRPKNKLVPRKKWLKAQSRRRKAQRR
ncbi:hypothetical protein M569_10133, partial [Genlisea aurea]